MKCDNFEYPCKLSTSTLFSEKFDINHDRFTRERNGSINSTIIFGCMIGMALLQNRTSPRNRWPTLTNSTPFDSTRLVDYDDTLIYHKRSNCRGIIELFLANMAAMFAR